jgi:hypothetical protein
VKAIRFKYGFFAAWVVTASFALSFGCACPSPVETVQTYLRMLSGDRAISEDVIASTTTEHYRTTTQLQIETVTQANREWILDRAEELRQNPAIQEFLNYTNWTTTYNVVRVDESNAEVIARVILSERHPGDREHALALQGVPEELMNVFRRGLELVFTFRLVKENDRWKIDDVYFPEALAKILESDDQMELESQQELPVSPS